MGHTAQKGQVACLHLQVTKALKLRPEKCKATNQGKEWEFEVLRELYTQRPKTECMADSETTSHLEHRCSNDSVDDGKSQAAVCSIKPGGKKIKQ